MNGVRGFEEPLEEETGIVVVVSLVNGVTLSSG